MDIGYILRVLFSIKYQCQSPWPIPAADKQDKQQWNESPNHGYPSVQWTTIVTNEHPTVPETSTIHENSSTE